MVTWEELLKHARTLDGVEMKTAARGKRVHVEVIRDMLIYTPETGKPRPQTRTTGDKILSRYNEIKQLTPGHYSDLTVNSSYFVTLLSSYLSRP